MDTWLIVLLIVLGVILVGMIVLYFLGKKLQKKQEASEQQMQAGAQTTSLFVIKKDRVRLRDAGFPQIVIDQTPKLLRRSKIPTVKAKVGPRIITFMCDEKAFSVIALYDHPKGLRRARPSDVFPFSHIQMMQDG